MPTEQHVLDSLRHIMDPDIGRDIVSLGFVKNIKIEDGTVAFDLELTTPACPVRDRFKQQAEAAVMKLPGVNTVSVTLTARPHPQARQQQPQTKEQVNTLVDVDAVIAVSSCKGGVGKSTVAAHLARAMVAEGLQVGLLDADLYGPSFPTLFNIFQPEVYMQDNRIVPVEHDGMKIMSFGFLLGDNPAVLRGPIVSGYIQQLLLQTQWGKLDYLIIDMPPGTGDIQLTITQAAKLDGAVIVTTPQSLSLADVAKGILMFEKVEVPVLGLVENMSYFVCDGCGKEHRLFGASAKRLSDRFGLETLAEIPVIPGISQIDAETPPQVEAAMRDLAANIHRSVGRRRIETIQPSALIDKDGVTVQWPNGTETRFSNRDLRGSCGCARCVDEYTGVRHALDDAVLDNAEIENVQPLGNYAVSVSWSDGHSSIYPWKDLQAR